VGALDRNTTMLLGSLSSDTTLTGHLTGKEDLRGSLQTGSGTSDYERLINHPSINEVELIRDKSFSDLGLNALSNMELEDLLN